MRLRSLPCLVLLYLLASPAGAADSVASFTLPSGHRVRIVEAPFEESRLKYSEAVPCLVDGKIPFGTDCSKPVSYLKSLTVRINKKVYRLDSSQMFNVWGDRPLAPKDGKGFRYFGGHCTDAETCTFRGIFSDGAGTFAAEWRVFNGATTRTVVSNDEEVMAPIWNNIDAKP